MCKGKNKRKWKVYREIGCVRENGKWHPKAVPSADLH